MNFRPGKSSKLRQTVLALGTALVVMSSYVFLPQPKFEAPKSEEGAIDYSPSEAYITKNTDGSYQICIENETPRSISDEYAMFLKGIGFQLKEK